MSAPSESEIVLERDNVFLDACRARLESSSPFVADGRVCSMVGVLIEGEGVPARTGSVCRVETRDGDRGFEAEVVGFREGRILLMPLEEPRGVGPGARIRLRRRCAEVMAGPNAPALLPKEIEFTTRPDQ